MRKNNFKHISIVTFISKSEIFNPKIFSFYSQIKQDFDTSELIIFTDKNINQSQISEPDVHEICDNGATKYKRILKALTIAKSDMILFLDNDISPDLQQLRVFLENYDDADLCFGRIGVTNAQKITEHLVRIDKYISHGFIRPLLWRCGIGVSVLGQIFVLKKDIFKKILSQNDTVFDDLSIGACAKENNCKVQISKMILGTEKASRNLKTLFKQRIRWAQGYSETLDNYRNTKAFPFVIIHGIAYHAVFPCLSILLLLSAVKYPITALILWCLLCIVISAKHIKEFPFALLYTIVFPLVHMVWLAAFLMYHFQRKNTTRRK